MTGDERREPDLVESVEELDLGPPLSALVCTIRPGIRLSQDAHVRIRKELEESLGLGKRKVVILDGDLSLQVIRRKRTEAEEEEAFDTWVQRAYPEGVLLEGELVAARAAWIARAFEELVASTTPST